MTAKKPTADVTAADTTATGAATDTPQPEARQPLPVPDGGWPADEYTGKGGTYVRDPYTGIRTPLVE